MPQHNQAASQSFTEPAQSNQGYTAENSFQNERESERVAWSYCSKSRFKSNLNPVASPGIHQPARPKLQHIPLMQHYDTKVYRLMNKHHL